MPLPEENREALLNYALLLSNTISDNQSGSLRSLVSEVVAKLGKLACVQHAHLFVLRKSNAPNSFASLYTEWGSTSTPEIGPNLQDVRLQLFGTEAVKSLRSGNAYFSQFDEENNACSKLVSGLLRELGLSSYELIPIISGGRLAALIGLAHVEGPDHLDHQSRRLIQLAGNVLIRSIQMARRERVRRNNHKQWKRVVNGACDFAVRVDSNLEISAVIAFRQQKPPQVRGLLLTEFVSRSSCESVLELIEAVNNSSQPRSIQFFGINANGRPCSYAARIEPASSKSRKRDLTLFLTNNDVERAHAEELSCLREQLDRATRLSLLGNIATEFAHQLTQPLQAISNHIYTLRSRIRKTEPHPMLLSCADNIETSVDHAGAIINSLRDFLTNRRMKLGPAKLATMVQHAVTMVEAQSERVGAKVHMLDPHGMLENELSPVVDVDTVQTTHVIINLLVNAIEACGEAKTEAPEILITARPDANSRHVIVEVSDNGPGLSPENPDGVFERFFTTKSDGFGIGLAICRDVIERQGGNIRARNNSDRGCCFSFTLLLYTRSEKDEASDVVTD